MRRFFEPSAAPPWLKQTLSSIRQALGDVWDVPVRLAQFTTAERPAASEYKSGLIFDTTDARPAYSDGAAWFGFQPFDADVAAYAALSTTGLVVRTGAGTAATRSIAVPAAGLSITNADGVSGNPTLALANDLAAVEGLATAGLAVRTAADTWATRTITGTANQITVANGDGVAAAPTLSLPSAITTPGSLAVTGDADFNGAAFEYETSAPNFRIVATGANASTIRFIHADASERGLVRFDSSKDFIIERAGVEVAKRSSTGWTFTGAPSFAGDMSLNGDLLFTSGRVLKVTGTTVVALATTGLDITGEVRCDSFRIDAAATAETPAATHTVVINVNGTNMRFLCLV